LKGPFIVQLSKWENVSYPKINEHVQNDGVCSLIITDGAKSTKAMTTEPLANISGETPYGVKILLTGDIKIENGILQLNAKNCKYIGGTVDKMVEKWKTERFSSNKDARTTTEAPKWSSISTHGVVAPKKEKDNFKAMAVIGETKQVENTEFEAARQKEIENLKALHKNVHVPSVKLPDNVKKDNNTVTEKAEEKPNVIQKQEKQDRYNNRDNNAPKSNFRTVRGRNTDNYEDIRTYVSQPSATSTLFDHISKQIPNLPAQSSSTFTKNETVLENRRYNSNSYENKSRDGYGNQRQSSRSNAATNEISQMKISDAPQGSYGNRGNRRGNNAPFRGRGGRNRGGTSDTRRGRGGGYQGNNYRGQYGQQHQPLFQQSSDFPPLNPSMMPPQPQPGYVPSMPHFTRNTSSSEINQGQQVLAPFVDNSVRKTYYNNSRKC
jgi:hypothetical protein